MTYAAYRRNNDFIQDFRTRNFKEFWQRICKNIDFFLPPFWGSV